MAEIRENGVLPSYSCDLGYLSRVVAAALTVTIVEVDPLIATSFYKRFDFSNVSFQSFDLCLLLLNFRTQGFEKSVYHISDAMPSVAIVSSQICADLDVTSFDIMLKASE